MGFIYVYTNDYFNEKNIIKIGSTLNPLIRLYSYTTYYQDKGKFEFLFNILDEYLIDSPLGNLADSPLGNLGDSPLGNPVDRLVKIELSLKNNYLSNYNTKNNGSTGGTEIYQNINIKQTIIKCLNELNIAWTELDANFPPITKKYINIFERQSLKNYREISKTLNKKINYNKVVNKQLSKQDVMKTLTLNKSRAAVEIKFFDMFEKTIGLTANKNLGVYIICRESDNFDFTQLEENISTHSLREKDIWLPLIISTDFTTEKFDVTIYNDKWSSIEAPLQVFPHIKQTLYDGLIINNSVAVFNLPINSYKCSLTLTPPKQYGQITDLNIDQISEVGTPYGYYDLPEIRKSKYTYSEFGFNGNHLKDIVIENLKELVPNDKQEEVYWNTRFKYKVIEYLEGDFFTEHSDHKINKRHYGTLLIFPPAKDNLAHTGGNFIIKTGGYETVIPTSLNNDWKCVAFLTELKHECYKIISGKRIVLKIELVYKKNYFNHFHKNQDGCED
uniref:Prolyl 4-hydroxylase alpha subunit Fe(2+) 2OG dioxygenase domain-containing protein n=1 Tax=viral metagenome TaxID=1070528 RepID=A0A6C0EKJ9_9ZZZZ